MAQGDTSSLFHQCAIAKRQFSSVIERLLCGWRHKCWVYPFHREGKVFSIYELVVAKNGPKLKQTAAPADDPAIVGPAVVYPQRVVLPGRNATMRNFVTLLQRAILDRPVVDKTGLTGRYDFDLEWAPDETQFGGDLPPTPADTQSPPLFSAMEEQLGLRLVATRGPVEALIVDQLERPSAN
jgi:uncharacterized protein (TIGR03435 family)